MLQLIGEMIKLITRAADSKIVLDVEGPENCGNLVLPRFAFSKLLKRPQSSLPRPYDIRRPELEFSGVRFPWLETPDWEQASMLRSLSTSDEAARFNLSTFWRTVFEL